mmetsp:Transcript_18908/g.27188  ORF Transcript_18908/g.27188 Transcript_18908/m.27188 type:complete len:112 (-) Transcript_18908:362-697(-)
MLRTFFNRQIKNVQELFSLQSEKLQQANVGTSTKNRCAHLCTPPSSYIVCFTSMSLLQQAHEMSAYQRFIGQAMYHIHLSQMHEETAKCTTHTHTRTRMETLVLLILGCAG